MAETNARKRPIGFVETSTVESDDYILIDGQTSGTRKIKPDKVGKANTSDLNNDAGFQNASEVAAAIAANIDTELETAGKAADAKAVGDALATKVDAASGKGLSTNDYTTAEKTKLAGIATGATRVLIDSGLSESGKAADAAAVGTALAGKVDKVTGKGLSANDYTTAEKTKLAGIQEGAAAVDSTLSVTGKAADAKKTGDEITLLKQDISELQDGKADASGTAENLIAGNAEQLMTDKGVTDKVPYLLRASGGDGADREVDKIVGGTVAWNQLVQNGNFASTTGWNISTAWSIANNKATFNASPSASTFYNLYQVINTVVGHKYFVSVFISGFSGTPVMNRIAFSSAWGNCPTKLVEARDNGNYAKITQAVSAETYVGFKVQLDENQSFTQSISNYMIIDLTQMFGATIADRAYALEQATAGSGINWLKSMGFFTADYYPYDAGSLKSVEGLTAHNMVGFNQWDEEWEVISNMLYSKNYIPVLPNTQYYITLHQGRDYICFDRDFNEVKAWTWLSSAFSTFTTPSNCYYIKFRMMASYGTTYNHDICINLSDPAKNGTYEPYVKRFYPLDSTLTLRGIPKLDSNNQLYYDGDTYASDGTVTRRYGIVDLGMLTWTYSPTYTNFVANITNLKRADSVLSYPKAICAKYEVSTGSNTNISDYDKIFAISTSYDRVIIRDNSYTDPAVFKTAMSGVYLVYELATPTTEEAAPFTNPQIVDPYGTEEYETTGIVPVGHETFYPENLRKKIEGLPFNFATLIAPTESTYKATRTYSTGNLFIVDNILYKATTSIASGGTITPGTNCTATTLAEIIAALS